MRYFIILTLSIVFSLQGNAQLTSKPHFISVNVGTNIPLGEYQELDSISNGSASSGLYYSFETAVYISKFLGLGANIGAFSNPVNEEKIEDQLKRDFGIGSNYEVNSSDWVNAYALAGPYLTFGTEAIQFDIKFLAGIVQSEKPLINVSTNTSGQVNVSKSEESTASSFGFNYGLHLRLKLIGKLGLRINAEGFSTQQEFKSKVKNKNNGNETVSESTLKKEIQALNLGAGLVLTF